MYVISLPKGLYDGGKTLAEAFEKTLVKLSEKDTPPYSSATIYERVDGFEGCESNFKRICTVTK